MKTNYPETHPVTVLRGSLENHAVAERVPEHFRQASERLIDMYERLSAQSATTERELKAEVEVLRTAIINALTMLKGVGKS